MRRLRGEVLLAAMVIGGAAWGALGCMEKEKRLAAEDAARIAGEAARAGVVVEGLRSVAEGPVHTGTLAVLGGRLTDLAEQVEDGVERLRSETYLKWERRRDGRHDRALRRGLRWIAIAEGTGRTAPGIGGVLAQVAHEIETAWEVRPDAGAQARLAKIAREKLVIEAVGGGVVGALVGALLWLLAMLFGICTGIGGREEDEQEACGAQAG